MDPRLGWLLLLCATTCAAEQCVAIKRSGGGTASGGGGVGTKSDEGIALCEQDATRQQSEQACKAGPKVGNLDPAIECKWQTEDTTTGLVFGIGLGALFAVGITNQIYIRVVKPKGSVSSPTPLAGGSPPTQAVQAIEMSDKAHEIPVVQAQVVGIVDTPT